MQQRKHATPAAWLPVVTSPKWQPADVRLTTRRKLWRLVVSGGLLAAQWGSYAWAVGHTSLAHTLLFLSATPVLLAGWHWVSRQPISAGERASALVGVL
jgi:drug/metabolite transporter (DMT)-like permease